MARKKEADELQRLEAVVEQGRKQHRKAIEALREIRERDLYKPMYESFDDYIETRWGRTRQWATQEINWLRATECLEASGKTSYQFSVGSIQCAASLLNCDPEGFCTVYEAAAQKSLPVTAEAMKTALAAYTRYANLRDEWERYQDRAEHSAEDNDEEPPERLPALTWEEGNALEVCNKDWGSVSYNLNLVDESKRKARTAGKTWQECLADVCLDAGQLPTPNDLLCAVRGDDLKAVCKTLQEVVIKKWAEEDIANEALKELDKKRKELLEKAGIRHKTKKGKTPEPSPDPSNDELTQAEAQELQEANPDPTESDLTDEDEEILTAKMEAHNIQAEPQDVVAFLVDVIGITEADVLALLKSQQPR